MARSNCNLERNIRIYKAYLRGVRIKSIANLVDVSSERVRQIIMNTEHMLNIGDRDYIAAMNNLDN